jgi:hypothetical protein
MALSIGVYVDDIIYIDDKPLKVLSLVDHTDATVEVNGSVYNVTDQESIEILPGVLVSCGAPRIDKRSRDDVLPRLLFEAPMSVVILRKELYERKHY